MINTIRLAVGVLFCILAFFQESEAAQTFWLKQLSDLRVCVGENLIFSWEIQDSYITLIDSVTITLDKGNNTVLYLLKNGQKLQTLKHVRLYNEVGMRLMNVTLADDGVYKCSVFLVNGSSINDTRTLYVGKDIKHAWANVPDKTIIGCVGQNTTFRWKLEELRIDSISSLRIVKKESIKISLILSWRNFKVEKIRKNVEFDVKKGLILDGITVADAGNYTIRVYFNNKCVIHNTVNLVVEQDFQCQDKRLRDDFSPWSIAVTPVTSGTKEDCKNCVSHVVQLILLVVIIILVIIRIFLIVCHKEYKIRTLF